MHDASDYLVQFSATVAEEFTQVIVKFALRCVFSYQFLKFGLRGIIESPHFELSYFFGMREIRVYELCIVVYGDAN